MSDVLSPAKQAHTDARPTALSGSDMPALHQGLVAHMSAPVVESTELLKACVAAVSALVTLKAHCQRSKMSEDVATAGRALDVAGTLLLDGQACDVEQLLVAESAKQAKRVQRASATRSWVVQHALTGGLDRPLLDSTAARLAGDNNGVRSQAVGVRERRKMQAGQRLVNDAVALDAALDAWIDFVERGAGDAEPVLLVGAAHRRWLHLRPYADGNVPIGLALTDAMLQAESLVGEGALPLAWLFAGDGCRYRDAVGSDDEHQWLLWWLSAVGSAAAQWLQVLLGWESEVRTMRASRAFVASGMDVSCARLLCGTGFSASNVAQSACCSRARAQRIIDAAVADGLVCESERGRTRRFSHVRVLRLLLAFSLVTEDC